MKKRKSIKNFIITSTLAVSLAISCQARASIFSDILDDLDKLDLLQSIWNTIGGDATSIFSLLSSMSSIINFFNITDKDSLTSFFGSRTSGYAILHDNQTSTVQPTKESTANQLTTNTAQSTDGFQNQLASYKSTQNCTNAASCPAINAQAIATPTGYTDKGVNAGQAANTLSGGGVGYTRVTVPPGQAPTPEAIKYASFNNTQMATQSTANAHLGKTIGERTPADGKTTGVPAGTTSKDQSNTLNFDQMFGSSGIGSVLSTIGGPFTFLFQLPPMLQSTVSLTSHMADSIDSLGMIMSSLTTIANMAMQYSIGEQMLQSAQQSLSALEGKKSPGG